MDIRRDVIIRVRMTEGELGELEDRARRVGVTVSWYVREALKLVGIAELMVAREREKRGEKTGVRNVGADPFG